jgi:predicted aminopeptidase
MRSRSDLEKLYASDALPEEKRRRKAEAFDALKRAYAAQRQDWGGFAGYDRWFAQLLGNAHLAAVSFYTQQVPAFEVLLKQQGNDLPRFYAAVRELAALPAAERRQRLSALQSLQ